MEPRHQFKVVGSIDLSKFKLGLKDQRNYLGSDGAHPYPHLDPQEVPEKRTENAPNIMILDNSSLGALATPIPASFFRRDVPFKTRPKTYLDLIRFQPTRQVGEIHIPDIIAFEAANCTSFINPETHKEEFWENKIARYENNHNNYAVRRAFMEQALHGAHQVRIIHFPETRALLQKMDEAAAPLLEFISHAHGNMMQMREEYWPLKKQVVAAAKTVRETEGAHLGEICITQHALNYAAKNNASVTVVMDDVWGHSLLARRVTRFNHKHPSREMRVNDLNALGLIQVFQKSGILEAAGLKPGISLDAHRDAIEKYTNEEHAYARDMQHYRTSKSFEARITAEIHRSGFGKSRFT